MRRKLWIAPLAILAIALFVWIGGEVVMHLWNWLLPALFGWRLITFWQAVGLLVLCRILFGRWGGRSATRSSVRRIRLARKGMKLACPVDTHRAGVRGRRDGPSRSFERLPPSSAPTILV